MRAAESEIRTLRRGLFPCEPWHQEAKRSEELFRELLIVIGENDFDGEHFVWGNCPRCQSTLVYVRPAKEAA